MKVQRETQEPLFVLHCKQEAINKEAQVSKPPLLSPRWEVLFLYRLGIHSLSCDCCVINEYLAATG